MPGRQEQRDWVSSMALPLAKWVNLSKFNLSEPQFYHSTIGI